MLLFEPESSLSPCVIVCPSPPLTLGLTIPPSLLQRADQVIDP
jgi:hypothetical protein